MKSWVLVVILFLTATSVFAQAVNGSQLRMKFRFGRIVLATGDTLDGPVAVQYSPDLLYLAQADGTVRTFAPAAVAACAVQEELLAGSSAATRTSPPNEPGQVRLFRTVAWSQDRGKARSESALFEQLASGDVLLVRRQHLIQRQLAFTTPAPTVGSGVFGIPVGNSRGLPAPAPTRYGTYSETRDEFFLAMPNGEIRELRNPRKDLLLAFPEQAQQLHAFALAHKLSFNTARELVDIVNYANSLLPAAKQQ